MHGLEYDEFGVLVDETVEEFWPDNDICKVAELMEAGGIKPFKED
jgi:hypothetical protein